MRIAVCDDMHCDQQKISEYLLQYANKLMLDIEIETFDSGSELLSAFQKFANKIIFLDIYMDGLSGVETAFKIREVDKDCMIIFTTTSPDYRTEGFEVGATHYLLKPLTYKRVEEALYRCNRLLAESAKCLCVTVDRHIVRVPMKDILYLEVFDKVILIHTAGKTLKTYMPFAQIEGLLDGPFLKCNRSYIVNMSHIFGVVRGNFQLENGETVPIRNNGRQKVIDEYTLHFLSSIRGHDDA